MENPTANTKDPNGAETKSDGKKCSQRPLNVPGLFRFVRSFSGSYVAEMDPKLSKKHSGCSTRSPEVSLVWALDMATQVEPEDLDNLVSKNGYMQFWGLDADEESESPDPEFKSRFRQINVMAECCRIVLEIQRAIGTDLAVLLGKSSTEADRNAMVKRFAKTMRAATMHFQGTKGRHRGALYVTVKHANGIVERMSLFTRALQIALDLATSLQRAPVKFELRKELIRQYEHLEKKPKGFWAQLYRKAGLTGLKKGRSWTEPPLKKRRLEGLKRKGITT